MKHTNDIEFFATSNLYKKQKLPSLVDNYFQELKIEKTPTKTK